MISVKVTYRVRPDFVKSNEENIKTFMKDFRKLDSRLFQYAAFLLEDGTTFVHHSIYKDEEIQKTVLNVDSFKRFQKLRDESNLVGEPKIEIANVIDATIHIN
jgi:heme-degrading monooxygenase HmoA